jgi:hypothetical protein
MSSRFSSQTKCAVSVSHRQVVSLTWWEVCNVAMRRAWCLILDGLMYLRGVGFTAEICTCCARVRRLDERHAQEADGNTNHDEHHCIYLGANE